MQNVSARTTSARNTYTSYDVFPRTPRRNARLLKKYYMYLARALCGYTVRWVSHVAGATHPLSTRTESSLDFHVFTSSTRVDVPRQGRLRSVCSERRSKTQRAKCALKTSALTSVIGHQLSLFRPLTGGYLGPVSSCLTYGRDIRIINDRTVKESNRAAISVPPALKFRRPDQDRADRDEYRIDRSIARDRLNQ